MPPSERPIRVLKFGGAALADADRVRHVAEIVASTRPIARPVVVVSALYAVTDALEATITQAANRDLDWRQSWSSLRNRHLELAGMLSPPQESEELGARLERLFVDLEDLLHGTYLLRECSARTRDAILAFGERSSAPLVAAAFRRHGIEAEDRDARQMIATDDTFGQAKVDFERSYEAVRAALGRCEPVPVVTGFIAATERGETTTLGRGGSDYTAALLAAALSASALELWKDVDGVLSADPRIVPEAETLEHLSYAELMEMSHFGAKVIHPPSVHPTRRHGIPLRIRNFQHPERPGTTVTSVAAEANDHLVRGISSISNVALLRLEGDGMVGVPGVAMRLFGALARRAVNVILISQGSSEHSICFAVAPEDLADAQRAVSEEFELERQVGLVDELVIDHDCSILAIVGEGMRERPGIAGRLFGILGAIGVSVRAIAQGSSELNLSLVVSGSDHQEALRAAHSAFFVQPRALASVVVLGQGQVGGALVDQLASHDDLRVVCLANRRRTERCVEGVDLVAWRERVDRGESLTLDDLASWLEAEVPGPRLLIDCTAAAEPGAIYERLLRAGVGVVCANKIPFSARHETWDALHAAASAGRAPLRYEATVGAGLPVLSTLASLLASGDRIVRIEGVLSGTLNYLCELLGSGAPFSAAVQEAHRRGFTEPDPWDDLSGEDVRRKLCILARLCGLDIESEQIDVRSPLPGDGWGALSLDELWRRLPECDDDLAEQRAAARASGARLRFVASLDPAAGRAEARLMPIGPEHPCYDLRGTDNAVAFFTARYRSSPLRVQGPGAGPEVTAGGVLADAVQAARELSRRRGP